MNRLQRIDITSLQDPALKPYMQCNETQLKHYYEPHGGVFLAESPQVICRALDAGYEPVSFLCEEIFLEKVRDLLENHCTANHCTANPSNASPCTASPSPASPGEENPLPGEGGSMQAKDGIPVYTAPLPVLTKITGYHLTKGMLCLMKRKELPAAEDLVRGARRIAVLERVTNPTNIGAIFRSAAALGMDCVLLSADCCDPLYRRAVRVSVGMIFQVPWTILPSSVWPDSGLSFLKKNGFCSVSLALVDDAVPIDDARLSAKEKIALILGNEGFGLCPETIQKSDYRAIIPISEGVDSLNVAAASAVAFWQLRK